MAISDHTASYLYRAASMLQEPACKVREYWMRSRVEESLLWQRVYLVSAVAAAALALLTTLPGICLRYGTSLLQKDVFLSLEGDAPEKSFTGSAFTHLNWNICGPAGGYSISYGGVVPWTDRIDAVVAKIVETNADVVTLCEVFDADCAFALYNSLKAHYAHFNCNIGTPKIGPNSGLFVASKLPLSDREFTTYPEETLVGSGKNLSRGLFGFTVSDRARVYTTHLQHSAEVDYPSAEEIEGRRAQMEIVMEKVGQSILPTIVTGDFNLDRREFSGSSWSHRFAPLPSYGTMRSWGGDQFCAHLEGFRPSQPSDLDYTLNYSTRSVHSSLIDAQFDHTRYRPKALSDHLGVHSTIFV